MGDFGRGERSGEICGEKWLRDRQVDEVEYGVDSRFLHFVPPCNPSTSVEMTKYKTYSYIPPFSCLFVAGVRYGERA
jgi:hypothetical protein